MKCPASVFALEGPPENVSKIVIINKFIKRRTHRKILGHI
jgi:hypothetical protein